MQRRYRLSVIAFLAVILLVSITLGSGCTAQPEQEEYPTHHVTMMVGFKPGGDSDAYCRILALGFEKYLGVPVPVVNMTGSGSLLMAHYVLVQSPPDGYYIGELASYQPKHTARGVEGPNVITDSAPLGFSVNHMTVLGARADSKYKTFQDFIDDVKARPGQVKVGCASVGGTTHLPLLLLDNVAGLEIDAVPFGSTAPALTEVLGGRLDLICGYPLTFLPYMGEDVEENLRLRPLCLFGDSRSSFIPDVPTSIELGFDVAVGSYEGAMVNKATPEDILRTLRTAFKNIAEDPEFVDKFTQVGFNVEYKSPEETIELLDEYYDIAVELVAQGIL